MQYQDIKNLTEKELHYNLKDDEMLLFEPDVKIVIEYVPGKLNVIFNFKILL